MRLPFRRVRFEANGKNLARRGTCCTEYNLGDDCSAVTALGAVADFADWLDMPLRSGIKLRGSAKGRRQSSDDMSVVARVVAGKPFPLKTSHSCESWHMQRLFLTYLVLASFLSVVGPDAFAQQRVPNYRYRSPLSPYTGYFSNNAGATNPYFSFVRPQLMQNQLNQLQQQQVDQLSRTVQLQQQMLLDPFAGNQNSLVGPGAGLGTLQVRPTSTGPLGTSHAGYLNYSHFYYHPLQPGGESSSRSGGRRPLR